VGRLRKILAVFARHGFQNVVDRAKLGRFVFNRFKSQEIASLSTPERLRISFEQLGPTFVKLGQLLASRPDLIPLEWSEEFRKLHDQVTPVEFKQIESVLQSHFGAKLSEVFLSFDEKPFAAASIAQVHHAELKDGTKVVVKVQRPGINSVIAEDLQILSQLAELIEKFVPEARRFNPVGIIKEFGRTMELETNFAVEANNIRRFQMQFAGDSSIKIPAVFPEYSGRRVLVMEALEGIPLTQKRALEQEGIDREEILRRGLRAYLKMVYEDGFFHGDLHAGNILIMPDNQLGLVDFGVVGRLNRHAQAAIANMFLALADEDFDRMVYVYIDLAPFTDAVDVDAFARDIRNLLAPYLGLTMKHVNIGRLLMQSAALASQHGLTLPPELVLFFKSIVAIEGMGRLVSKDFDFLKESLAYAKEQVQSAPDPKQLLYDASFFARDAQSLLQGLPRQLKFILRRLNDPSFALKIESIDSKLLRATVDSGFRQIFWGLILAAVILGLLLRTR
jgi:ubiquinone biosynthesis protein